MSQSRQTTTSSATTSSDARAAILGRIREGLRDVRIADPVEDVPVDWVYGCPMDTKDVVADLVEKIEDYRATVVRVRPDQVTGAITEALTSLGARSTVVPDGVDPAWVEAIAEAGIEIAQDDPPLTHEQLNQIDAVVSGCAVAMADSGTIALDHGPGQGRRALTLLPDRHICVVRVDQVVSDVPEGVARLAEAIRARRPITWLSGGSATSDIELIRVEGVHGPRQLWVVLVEA